MGKDRKSYNVDVSMLRGKLLLENQNIGTAHQEVSNIRRKNVRLN
jgi:hypothetical protein